MQHMNIYERMEKIFYRRYKKVFEDAPEDPAARIKYFCSILIKLAGIMFSDDWKERYFAYDDFFNLYMEGVDLTLSRWCVFDRRIRSIEERMERNFHFKDDRITKDNICLLLTQVLGKIVSTGQVADRAAKEKFLIQLAKLFELCRESMYIFESEMDERKEAGLPQVKYDEIERWLPEFLREQE